MLRRGGIAPWVAISALWDFTASSRERVEGGEGCAHLPTVTLFLNGSPYCEARLAGSGVGAQSIWILEITKPLAPTDASFLLQVGDGETMMAVDLLKSSVGPADLRIVIGLPGY